MDTDKSELHPHMKIKKETEEKELKKQSQTQSKKIKGTREILLFGLSGNPPTGFGGHAGVIKFLSNLERFDEIWIFPVYKHMYTEKNQLLIPYEERMDLCRLNFEDLGSSTTKVIVKDFEKQVHDLKISEISFDCQNGNGKENKGKDSKGKITTKTPKTTTRPTKSPNTDNAIIRVGTIDIIDWIEQHLLKNNNKKNSNQDSLALVLGTDTFLDIAALKWRRSEELIAKLHFVLLKRPGYNNEKLNALLCDPKFKGKATLYEHDSLTDISSTSIRKAIQEKNLRFLKENLRHQVLNYILKYKLYEEKQNQLDKKKKKESNLMTSLPYSPLIRSAIVIFILVLIILLIVYIRVIKESIF